MGNLMEKELRRQQNLLVEAAVGVILFAIWSVAKVNLYLGHSSLTTDDVYRVAEQIGINEKYFLAFMIVVVASFLIWQLSVRMYIALSAIAEGKGKRKKSCTYLVIAAVLLITDLQSIWQAFGVDVIRAGEEISVNLITGFFMEAASAYVLLELLISGIRVKKLRKCVEG